MDKLTIAHRCGHDGAMSHIFIFASLLSHFLFIQAFAQKAVQLSSQQEFNLEKQLSHGDLFLFIQEDCEACEKALKKIGDCPVSVRQKINLVALGTPNWALKKSLSKEVLKISPLSIYHMLFSEAKKLDVKGTPTFRWKQGNELKIFDCEDLKKAVAGEKIS